MAFNLPMTWQRRWVAALTVLVLLPSFSVADTPAIPPPQDSPSGNETVQPKFIWGLIIQFFAGHAFASFFSWTREKLFNGLDMPTILPRDAAVSPPGAARFVPVRKDSTPLQPNTTDTAPTVPITVSNGQENYQGAYLSLMVLQADGKTLVVRPLSAGFKSGEKFRIRIGTTFDSELTLDNVDPHGIREHLYPAQKDQAVAIKKGIPVILPLEPDGFFQFDQDSGEEHLIVSVRDARAQGNAISENLVHREDNAQGTGLLQEVGPGKFAAIAETLALQHR